MVSSINGLLGTANQIVYNANKSAVLSYARDLHVLAKPFGVSVSVVAPGFIAGTDMTEPQTRFEGARMPEWASGDVDHMGQTIWKGIRKGTFLITYPLSHFIMTFISYAKPPTGWISASRNMMNSGLISQRLT
jgi:short-subunit dehydrogenase